MTQPKAARPFDKHRTGMVMGEGAGSIIIEELSHAQARGATIYGEVLGHASATVANRQRVADRARALELVLQGCLRDAHKTARDVGHIHAHGLGTQSCDVAEARRFREFLSAGTATVGCDSQKCVWKLRCCEWCSGIDRQCHGVAQRNIVSSAELRNT